MVCRFFWLVVFLLGLLMPGRTLADSAAVPRFENAACPFAVDPRLTEGKGIRCGYLIVPENRADPNSKTIRLAVAIVKSAATNPRPDPVFFLNGGPGGSTLSVFGPIMSPANLDFWAGNRDLILIDQRGTGFSTPSLVCPEYWKAGRKILTTHLSFTAQQALESKAVKACKTRLTRQGVDLSGYTSAEDARDIADLRAVLGYEQVNLYGVSYGTRLALSVMRYFPAGIRSVVLDSVYAPGVSLFTDPLRSGARDLNLVLDSCAEAAQCGSTYPHLRKELYSVVRTLDKKPVKIDIYDGLGQLMHVVVSGQTFLSILFQVMYVIGPGNQAAAGIPLAIANAYLHHFAPLERLAQNYAQLSIPPNFVSYGMYLSVECGEDMVGITQAGIQAAARSYPPPLRRDAQTGSLRVFHDCQIWNVPPVPAEQRAPVVSDIPTMIMEGEYDPITPPAYGAAVARTLSHSFSFVYPGLGHGTSFGTSCPIGMMRQFIDNPAKEPDGSCIAHMTEPYG